jgi:hypothetical protein
VNGGFSTRLGRWWAAYGGRDASYPFIMVDSGNQFSNGPVDYDIIYSNMVDNSMLRPSQANVAAYSWRNGNKVDFYVQLLNLTEVVLSPSNAAAIHGIIYEDTDVGVTSRYVRAVVSIDIPNLNPGAMATYTFETDDLEGVNWENLHFLVFADYIPPDSLGAYDMLQAALSILVPEPFNVKPNPLWFMIDPTDPPDPSHPLHFEGANFVNWSALDSIPWLTITPASGSYDTQPLVTIQTAALSPGMQQGVLGFSTTDGYFEDYVVVNVLFGPHEHAYLPFVRR